MSVCLSVLSVCLVVRLISSELGSQEETDRHTYTVGRVYNTRSTERNILLSDFKQDSCYCGTTTYYWRLTGIGLEELKLCQERIDDKA